MNYYNDNDPCSVAWLKELIKNGVLPPGDVDERSIKDVKGSDLKGFTQIHMFAGIGGWSEALRIAGISSDVPLWTGSCPCQPFSNAGKRQGKKDERHLWPEFFRLIRECKPNLIFGEQVKAAIGFGWLDGVFADLEGEGYTCGAAVLGAHSVGAPHIRQRLYWVADSKRKRFSERYAKLYGSERKVESYGTEINDGLEYTTGNGRGSWWPKSNGRIAFSGCGESGMGDSDSAGFKEQCGSVTTKPEQFAAELRSNLNFWSNSIWLPCADGKTRRIEPTIFPLASRIPGRVGLLRGSGNAICPQTAAEFIKAYFEIISELET